MSAPANAIVFAVPRMLLLEVDLLNHALDAEVPSAFPAGPSFKRRLRKYNACPNSAVHRIAIFELKNTQLCSKKL